MKPFSEYLCKIPPVPQKSKYTIVYIYDKGAVLYKGCPESEIFQSYMSDRSSGVHQYDFDEKAYQKAMMEYAEKIRSISKDFQKDLFEHFGVEHTKYRHELYKVAKSIVGNEYDVEQILKIFGKLMPLLPSLVAGAS